MNKYPEDFSFFEDFGIRLIDKTSDNYQSIKQSFCSETLFGVGDFGSIYLHKNDVNYVVKEIIYGIDYKSKCLFLQNIRNEVFFQSLVARWGWAPVVHEVVLTENGVFVVMEKIIGSTLFDCVYSLEISRKNILQLCYRMALLVNGIHQLGIVHRDIKFENILIVDNVPVFLDFGLSVFHDFPFLFPLNRDLGNPFFSPNEDFLRSDEIQTVYKNVDVYSLGILFIQLFVGHDFMDFETDQPELERLDLLKKNSPTEWERLFERRILFLLDEYNSDISEFEKNDILELIISMIRSNPRDRVSLLWVLEKLEFILHAYY